MMIYSTMNICRLLCRNIQRYAMRFISICLLAVSCCMYGRPTSRRVSQNCKKGYLRLSKGILATVMVLNFCSCAGLHGSKNGLFSTKKELNRNLMSAIWRNDLHKVESSLMKGADPNFNIGSVGTLHWCSEYADLDIVQVLVNAGADIGMRTSPLKDTPLHLAAGSGEN